MNAHTFRVLTCLALFASLVLLHADPVPAADSVDDNDNGAPAAAAAELEGADSTASAVAEEDNPEDDGNQVQGGSEVAPLPADDGDAAANVNAPAPEEDSNAEVPATNEANNAEAPASVDESNGENTASEDEGGPETPAEAEGSPGELPSVPKDATKTDEEQSEGETVAGDGSQNGSEPAPVSSDDSDSQTDGVADETQPDSELGPAVPAEVNIETEESSDAAAGEEPNEEAESTDNTSTEGESDNTIITAYITQMAEDLKSYITDKVTKRKEFVMSTIEAKLEMLEEAKTQYLADEMGDEVASTTEAPETTTEGSTSVIENLMADFGPQIDHLNQTRQEFLDSQAELSMAADTLHNKTAAAASGSFSVKNLVDFKTKLQDMIKKKMKFASEFSKVKADMAASLASSTPADETGPIDKSSVSDFLTAILDSAPSRPVVGIGLDDGPARGGMLSNARGLKLSAAQSQSDAKAAGGYATVVAVAVMGTLAVAVVVGVVATVSWRQHRRQRLYTRME